jgi:hypothetical protein
MEYWEIYILNSFRNFKPMLYSLLLLLLLLLLFILTGNEVLAGGSGTEVIHNTQIAQITCRLRIGRQSRNDP